MEYQIRFTPQAEKELEKLPENDRLRIKAAFSRLRHNPYEGKKLKGKLKNAYSLRVWPYRVAYYIYQKEYMVFIFRLKHRRDVYR